MSDLELFTDSAGITCRYTPVEQLRRGDVVIIGWRTTVDRIEIEEYENRARARVHWVGWPWPDKWLSFGTKLPVEVPKGIPPDAPDDYA